MKSVRRQKMPLKNTKTLKSSYGNSSKDKKAMPGQLRKSAKLHASQADVDARLS